MGFRVYDSKILNLYGVSQNKEYIIPKKGTSNDKDKRDNEMDQMAVYRD